MYPLTDEEQLLQAAARDFAQKAIAPVAAEIDREDAFPVALVQEMGALGWMGMLIPRDHGGSDVSALSYVLAIEEFARASGSVSLIVTAHNSLATWPIATFGSAAQKSRYLPALASGQVIGAYSLTEPNAGSDAASLQTRARREGNSYLISGRKAFVTSGDVAGLTVLFARTSDAPGARGVSAFLVERGLQGLNVGKPLDKMGMHGSTTVELVLEDCRVPAENVLGAEGEGFKIAMSVLDGGRLGIAAQAVGIAQAALDAALGYVRVREQFGRAIGQFQGVRWMLAEIHARVQAARLLTYHAARLKDRGESVTLAAATAKWQSSEAAVFAAEKAIQLHGGYGYIRETGVERLLRDAKITEIYEGTSEIQRIVISRQLLPDLPEAR